MQFLTFTVGSPDLLFSENAAVTREFMFPRPAQAAEAMLQGFDLQFEEADCELDRIKVKLETHHGAGDRSGTVDVSFVLSDDNNSIWASNLISGEIKILVVGL